MNSSRQSDDTGAQSTRKRAAKWAIKGFWAVLDQAMFAIANFAMNIMLARVLTPEQYGLFASTYSFFLLVGGFQNSFFAEPMLIFGPGKHADRFERYVMQVHTRQWHVLLGLAVGLGAAALLLWRLGNTETARSLAVVGVASPFILSYWLARRSCYATGAAGRAAGASGIYLALTLAGLMILRYLDRRSVVEAFLVLALASSVASLVLLAPIARRLARGNPEQVSGIASDHWSYGRWALAATVATWIPNNVYFFLLPFWVDLQSTAALKALITLTMPMSQVSSSLGLLLIPRLVKMRDQPAFMHTVAAISALFVVAGSLYWWALSAFRVEIVLAVFGHQYLAIAPDVAVVGALPILQSVSQVLAGALRAMERPELVFRGFLASTGAAVVAGFTLIPSLGVLGALLGLLAASLVRIIALIWLLAIGRR